MLNRNDILSKSRVFSLEEMRAYLKESTGRTLTAAQVDKKNTDKGSWMVYQGYDREYAEQVTAEHKVNVRSGKKNVLTWVQKNSHGDNHYLDCEVYAAASADILGVRELYLEDIAQAPAPPEPAPAPEEEWIKTHENWI